MTTEVSVKEKEPLLHLLCEIGRHLEFDVVQEVQAADSAWVDIVWFDRRLSPNALKFPVRKQTRQLPVLPVVGIEVELRTGTNAKHIKGSVSNLNNLGALVSMIVIGNGSLANLRKQSTRFTSMPLEELSEILMDRVYRWVYSESQARGRVVVMPEHEVVAWASRLGVST